MTTKSFSRIIVFPAAQVRVTEHPEDKRAFSEVTFVTNGKNNAVDKLLKNGWELIQVVTHYCSKRDITGVAYVMGLPKRQTRARKPKTK